MRLRDTTLGYHGSENDFTNLIEIRIGWFGPTNANDPLTGDIWWAANFAISEANEKRGDQDHPEFESLPFRLVPRWASDPWGSGVSQLTRMVYDEQPLALVGSVDSASTHLAEQVVAKANLPLVSPITTDKSVTLAGVSWMFSCAPSDTAIARALVDGVLHALQGAEGGLVLLTCTDHESRMTTREILKEFSRRGRLPDFRFEVPSGTRTLGKHLSAVERAHPAAVIVIAGAEDSARLVKALRTELPQSFGLRQSTLRSTSTEDGSSGAFAGSAETQKAAEDPSSVVPIQSGRRVDSRTPRRVRAEGDQGLSSCAVFGSHAMGRARFRELSGPAAEGVRFPLLAAAGAAGHNSSRFVERFIAEHKRLPDYTAILTYDSTRLLIEAIHRAGPNRARIREALTQLSPWSGLGGQIAFDGTGQNIRSNICLGTIRDGSIIALSGIVSAATNNTTAGL